MKKIVFLIVLCSLILCSQQSFAFKDGDLQYWLTTSADAKIKDNWKIAAEEELRWGGDVSDFYYNHTDLGVSYSGLADWLVLGANYRLVYEEKKSKWLYENRPHINVTFKGNLENFKISNRCRLEYRDKEKSKDGWRYRNKTTVKYPIKTEKFSFTPYVADEVFADFIVSEINRNRLYAGIAFKAMKYLSLDFYYMWEANRKNNNWTSSNILGTKIKLSF